MPRHTSGALQRVDEAVEGGYDVPGRLTLLI